MELFSKYFCYFYRVWAFGFRRQLLREGKDIVVRMVIELSPISLPSHFDEHSTMNIYDSSSCLNLQQTLENARNMQTTLIRATLSCWERCLCKSWVGTKSHTELLLYLSDQMWLSAVVWWCLKTSSLAHFSVFKNYALSYRKVVYKSRTFSELKLHISRNYVLLEFGESAAFIHCTLEARKSCKSLLLSVACQY